MMRDKVFWWYFKRVAFYCLLILITLFLITAFSTSGNFGINKTLGWAWDITNLNFWLGVILFLLIVFLVLSIVTFLIMKFIKSKKR